MRESVKYLPLGLLKTAADLEFPLRNGLSKQNGRKLRLMTRMKDFSMPHAAVVALAFCQV